MKEINYSGDGLDQIVICKRPDLSQIVFSSNHNHPSETIIVQTISDFNII